MLTGELLEKSFELIDMIGFDYDRQIPGNTKICYLNFLMVSFLTLSGNCA